jgi:hypothetical protein
VLHIASSEGVSDTVKWREMSHRYFQFVDFRWRLFTAVWTRLCLDPGAAGSLTERSWTFITLVGSFTTMSMNKLIYIEMWTFTERLEIFITFERLFTAMNKGMGSKVWFREERSWAMSIHYIWRVAQQHDYRHVQREQIFSGKIVGIQYIWKAFFWQKYTYTRQKLRHLDHRQSQFPIFER